MNNGLLNEGEFETPNKHYNNFFNSMNNNFQNSSCSFKKDGYVFMSSRKKSSSNQKYIGAGNNLMVPFGVNSSSSARKCLFNSPYNERMNNSFGSESGQKFATANLDKEFFSNINVGQNSDQK